MRTISELMNLQTAAKTKYEGIHGHLIAIASDLEFIDNGELNLISGLAQIADSFESINKLSQAFLDKAN